MQDIAFEAIKPGALCCDVDLAVRAYFDEHDLMPYWRHHTGHTIGLRYHEGPFLDAGDDTEILRHGVHGRAGALFARARRLPPFRHGRRDEDGIELVTYYPRDLDSLVIPL